MCVNLGIVGYLISRKYTPVSNFKHEGRPLYNQIPAVRRQPHCMQPTPLPVYICMSSHNNQRRSSRVMDQRRFLRRWLNYIQKTTYKIHILLPPSYTTMIRDDVCEGISQQQCTTHLIESDCLQHATKDAFFYSACNLNFLLMDSRLAIDSSFPIWLSKLDSNAVSCLVAVSDKERGACDEVGSWIPSGFTAYSNNVTLEAKRQGVAINYNPISIIPK